MTRRAGALRQDGGVPTSPAAAPRVDGSMSLLVELTTNALDEAYGERAALRTRSPTDGPERPGVPRGRRTGTVLALVAVGIVSSTAVAQVRGRQEADTGLRGRLAAEARDRTAQSDALDGRAETLRRELAVLRQAALGVDAAGTALAGRLTALGLASATTPVQGPGAVVTLDDAEVDAGVDGLTDPAGAQDGRVRDTDVQDAVNALWAAGAEAVAVNGQRLTALTAKRSAGDAILVDLLPLKPPYVIEAIGQPAALELGLLDGETGRRLTTYTSLYGLRLDVRREQELRLPGAADPTLSRATPVEPTRVGPPPAASPSPAAARVGSPPASGPSPAAGPS